MKNRTRNFLHAATCVVFVALLGFFFAHVEIQIEGKAGWAANLPVTFRIEKHWLLDIFWGGRPMTGYHAWVFPFVLLFCHLPVVVFAQWSWRLEARLLSCCTLFWIFEDALWFTLNPAYGWVSLHLGTQVWWHKHWFLGLPTDYWTFSAVGLALLWWSFRGASKPGDPIPTQV